MNKKKVKELKKIAQGLPSQITKQKVSEKARGSALRKHGQNQIEIDGKMEDVKEDHVYTSTRVVTKQLNHFSKLKQAYNKGGDAAVKEYTKKYDGVLVGIGYGHACFGELLQGIGANGKHYMISLPVINKSVCSLGFKPSSNNRVTVLSEDDYSKARQVIEAIKLRFNIEGVHVAQFFTGIPRGKGWGSSTADMYAALKAMCTMHKLEIKNEEISKLFALIEPHDPVMYDTSVLYDHRKGELLDDYGNPPSWEIVVVDMGGVVDTIKFNQQLSQTIYPSLSGYLNNFERNPFDLDTITRAAIFNADNAKKDVIERGRHVDGCLGAMITHSGVCVGFIFDKLTEGIVSKYKEIFPEFVLTTTKTRS